MKDNDKELNLDQLDDVTGGTQPSYPAGFRNGAAQRGKAVLESMQVTMITTREKMSNTGTAEKCPQCGAELRFDPEANASYCTGCGYTPVVNV